MFSSRIFLVSGLVFKSNPLLADFFVQYKIAVQFHFFFFCFWLSSLSNTIYWRDYIFSIILLAPLSKNNWPYMQRFICELSILFPQSMYLHDVCLFMSPSCCFDYCSFVIQLEIRRCNTFSFVFFFFFHDDFGYSGAFVDPMKILGLFYFCEKCHWNFERDYIESIV